MDSGSATIDIDFTALARHIKAWGIELGFAKVGIAGVDLDEDEARLLEWLRQGRHGTMDYMQRHGTRRSRPDELQPGTVRVISARMDYSPTGADADAAWQTLRDGEHAYIARYALGRDYHKVVRARLQRFADRIQAQVGSFGYRVFCDSAPVMEVELARRAGIGWRGKHTLLIDARRGSTFFLGTIYTDLELAPGEAGDEHCGTCVRCIEACPTGAIVAPYRLDARRCISYLTIEHKGAIPEELRPAIGNRIYGCDDCQLACPWNRFARPAALDDFAARERLDQASLVELFAWNAQEFDEKLAGSPIRRIGHERWLRNLAVALGNSGGGDAIVGALRARADDPSALVREHVRWALQRLGAPMPEAEDTPQSPGDVIAEPASVHNSD